MWLLILFLLFTSPLHAQDASPSTSEVTPTVLPTPTPRLFDQYQKDYLFQYDLYQQAYLKYVDKKKVYTKYGTITTQKEKFAAAIEAIDVRNKAIKSYLMALRELLDDYTQADLTTTSKNQIELEKWESWYNEQLFVVPAINNEDDLRKWVETFKINFPLTQQVIYTALIQHESNLRKLGLNQLQDIAQDIQSSANIRPESQQWVSSLAVKSDLVNTSLANAYNLTKKKQNQAKFSNFYPDAKLELSKSAGYLREISGDLKLIIIKFIQK
jgi:hypothetical protein